MKSIAEVLPTNQQLTEATEKPLNGSDESEVVQRSEDRFTHIFTVFWNRMTGRYGHKWTSQYNNDGAREEWASTLARLTDDQIGRGVMECRNSQDDWPPNANTFARYALSFDRDRAWTELLQYAQGRKHSLTDRIAYHCAQQIGFHELRTANVQLLEKRFNQYFNSVSWHNLPPDVPAPTRAARLPKRTRHRKTAEGSRHAARIRERFNITEKFEG